VFCIFRPTSYSAQKTQTHYNRNSASLPQDVPFAVMYILVLGIYIRVYVYVSVCLCVCINHWHKFQFPNHVRSANQVPPPTKRWSAERKFEFRFSRGLGSKNYREKKGEYPRISERLPKEQLFSFQLSTPW